MTGTMIYARVIEDYEIAWMNYYTIPKGTIVRLEIFNFPMLYLDNGKYVLIRKSHVDKFFEPL